MDCNWMNGNCYFFAIILKFTFLFGDMYYNLIQGHFLFKLDKNYYNFLGKYSINENNSKTFYK